MKYIIKLGALILMLALTVAVMTFSGCSQNSAYQAGNTQKMPRATFDVTDQDEWDVFTHEDYTNDLSFGFEKEIAGQFYGTDLNGTYEPTERDRLIAEYSPGCYAFDKSGTGVFVINVWDSADMGRRAAFFIEHTTDGGKTWTIDNVYYGTHHPVDVYVDGQRVYILRYSDLYGYGAASECWIMYSDDMCASFHCYDILAMQPEYKKLVEQKDTNAALLGVSEDDGSLIIGWYDTKDYYIDDPLYQHTSAEYYLIVKVGAELDSCTVLYADDGYIKRTAAEESDYE